MWNDRRVDRLWVGDVDSEEQSGVALCPPPTLWRNREEGQGFFAEASGHQWDQASVYADRVVRRGFCVAGEMRKQKEILMIYASLRGEASQRDFAGPG